MSGRGGQTWSSVNYVTDPKTGSPEHDGDIWLSKKNSSGEWGEPQVMKGISTSEGEDEPNLIDNQKFYYQTWGYNWKYTGGPYYMMDLKQGGALVATGLGGGINQFFVDREMGIKPKKTENKKQKITYYNNLEDLKKHEINGGNNYATDGMTLSLDGKIFIVAVGKYTGKMDLYISRKDSTGKWSYLTPLAINTKGNERTPFLAPDGKTLYFASDSYNTLGGLDIFKTTLYDNNECGEIQNVGEPINSKNDEQGFITNADNTVMMMVRNYDIISITPNSPIQQSFPEIKIQKDK